ncbi:MAG: S41 family peptidase [Bryobacteraceae bacterium]|nr:S41 family peptidase [Bryobacteraceae bacterium]MDW8379650.1 S41 family peptidase [Bryobacterales bacterium]
MCLILCGSILGGIFGPGVTGVAAASGDEDEISANVKSFTKLLHLVEENFAEKVAPEKAIYKGAIPGMLRTLDPHSSFFDPRDFQLLREDQRGAYFGVGMSVSERNRRTIVIAPFPGSPAYKAGIRPGDVIMEVNGKRTDNLSSSEVADLLKGQRGTLVRVTISREGVDKPLVFEIIRDEISRKSVETAFWLKPGIAHLDIRSFNENTSREVEENLKRLGEENIKGLIIDLRDNPGGLLSEGVAVAGRFLRKGQLVVSHKGRASAEKPYYAVRGNSGFEYPIVVVVNRFSASAAEIVAGALQDHDRAIVLGENTFGKGLVQTVFPLVENTGLALTTAKYYTPSGRLIQRDYSSGSFLDYYYKKDTATQNPADVRLTDSGRPVYGGGGIAPDEKFSSPKLNAFQSELIRRFAFFGFSSRFFSKHDVKLSKDWVPDEGTLAEFRQYLAKENIPFTEADIAENKEWLKLQIRRELFITAFSQEEARRIAIETDPVIHKAIETLPKAKALLESAKKLMVRR